ncbi:hypothetical protein [Brevibacterium moorei]|uniref:hypothetical protein n=1 Tax=Brevibacterium moorei TaxID=2968457 RepID=UPI00211CC21F|nr:hypothetical protein [Brevibacterium sp. 68QC2CO]MCQ9384458.1 hypothetical protein [Brevibacterium sp. 68QC2CO]
MTRGTVKSVAGDRVWLLVPRWFQDEPVGPVQAVKGPEPYAEGQRVLVAAVDGSRDDLIVLGVLGA